ncbi:MAG: sigma 54-interacting transcriptional regulator, partial [Thermodesulfobacteriota bacterium]|nr:sigma 54-interacting transcriptional regulator [Thermodesulfobacteriota bacterium]
GKELFAKAIHDNGPNAENRFVVVDCTNIPPMLAESLLFGHVRGSFTGAFESKVGLIKQAHEGTLFLDEIGDLPLSVQKSLLRVLQGRKFRPLGSKHEQTSNFRLIAATNGEMKVMVQAGRFRKDLYHRLSALNISLPPLKERMEDLGQLVDYYIAKICGERGVPAKQVSDEFSRALAAYDWPGNIRELINILSSSTANAVEDSTLYPQHLPVSFRVHLARMNFKPGQPQPSEAVPQSDIKEDLLKQESFPTFKETRETTIRKMELCYLDELVNLCKGDMSKACKLSGLSRARLYELFRRHNVVLKG